MGSSSHRKLEAAKAAGVAAQALFKRLVKEAVVEAIHETDYGRASDSGSGARSGTIGQSILLLGAGVAVGYLLASRPPSWLRSAEESIAEETSAQFDRIRETVEERGESAPEGEPSGSAPRGDYDTGEADDEAGVATGAGE